MKLQASHSQPNIDSTQPSLCCEALHSNTCPQILDPSWHYCPHCGSAIVKFSLHEVARHFLSNGMVETKVEVHSLFPFAKGALIQVNGPGIADRAQIGLIPDANQYFQVQFDPAEPEAVAVTVHIEKVTRQPNQDPFQDLEDVTRMISLGANKLDEARVEAIPAVLTLAPGESREIQLVATGQPFKMARFAQPAGIRVKSENNSIIRQNQPVKVIVEAISAIKNSSLEFFDVSDKLLASVQLVPRTVPGMKPKARFLVGIDFGTSGTSIWRSDSISGLPPQNLLTEERPPTAVFVDRPTVRSSWKYGAAAEAASRENPDGFLVTEFKKYLQEEDDTIPNLGISASSLLTWYVSKLMEDSVYARLAAGTAEQELSEGDIEWRITMPVYDSGQRSKRYRQRMLAAMREAGLYDYGNVELLLEPECALRYLVQSGTFQRAKVPMGSRVMVVDSGGGTTDVAIGTLIVDGDRLALQDVISYDMTLPKCRDNGDSIGSDFGGGDVTRLAGAYAIASFAKAGNLESRYSELARIAGTSGEGAAAFGFGPNQFFPTNKRQGFWHQLAPRLYDAVESVKRHLSNTPETTVVNVIGVGSDYLTLAQSDITDAIGVFSEEYATGVRDIIWLEKELGRDTPIACAFVGGNNILMGPELTLNYETRLVKVDKESVRMAVVVGAALPIPIHVPLSPFALTVTIDHGGGSEALLIYDRDIVVEHLKAKRIFDGPSAGTLTIEVVAEASGPRLLHRFTVPYDAGTLEVAADLEPNCLRIGVMATAKKGLIERKYVQEVKL